MCQSDCGSHSSRRWLGSNVPRRSVPGHVLSTILPHTGMLAVQPSSSPLRSLCLKQHVMSDNSNLAPCPTARCCHSGPRANGGLRYVSKNVPSLIAYNINTHTPIFGTCHQQIQSNGPWKQFRGEHRTRSLLRWEGIVENIGFEPGTKEWRSMDAWEWWWLQRWLDKWMRRWIEITLVMLMEWIWKLVPKTRWCTFCFCCLYKEYSYSQFSTVKRIKFTVWDRRFALREALKETPHGGKECNHPRNWMALDTLTK